MKTNIKYFNEKPKNKIVFFTLLLALVLTAFFAIAALRPQGFNVVAADDYDGFNTKLKFKQVEAGEDFVIALTYDGDLYGWSLRDDRANTNTLDTSNTTGASEDFSKTLGQYYPANPIKITPHLNKTEVKEKILKIATTQTTAAFITDKFRVYTWGLDKADEGIDGSANDDFKPSKKGLLFRNYSSNESDSVNFYEPAEMKYSGFKVDSAASPSVIDINPEANGKKPVDIYGGTDNYVVKTDDSSFVGWGNSFYGQVGKFANTTKEIIYGKFYDSELSDIYVGAGYMLGIKSSSLAIRGKNFYIPSVTMTDYTYDGTNLNLKNISGVYANTNALSDAKLPTPNGYVNIYAAFTKEMGAQGANVDTFNNITVSISSLGARTPVSFKDSETGATESSNTTLSKVAAGNGFVYALNGTGAGNLKFWGDNSVKQGGDTGVATAHFTAIQTISSGTAFTQVVAGQMPMGATINGGQNVIAKNSQSTPNVANAVVKTFTGNIGTATIEFYDPFIDIKDTYISAALTGTGSVYAWNSVKSAAEVTLPNGAKDKVVYLAPGYGNNLFALTDLGKIIHIKHVAESTNDFVASYIETFSNGTSAVSIWKKSDTPLKLDFASGYSNTTSVQIRAGYTYTGTYPNGADIKANGNILASTSSTDKRFITGSTSGDSFRILVNQSVIDYTKTGTTTSLPSALSDTDGDITFEFSQYDGTAWSTAKTLSSEALKKYIDFEVKYTSGATNATADIYFEIMPKQSTKNAKIIMSFNIGRTNSAEYFNNSANEVIYDYKTVSLEITIPNTATKSVVNSDVATEPNKNGNTLIPLLDVNNPYNNAYSMTALDVSGGIEQIADKIATIGTGTRDTVLGEFYDVISQADSGFPAQSKIANGNLDYTFGSAQATAYFDNKYKYFASDVDADFVELSRARFASTPVLNTVEVATVSVTFDLTSRLTFDEGNNFNAYIIKDSEFERGFNNRYGLTDIQFTNTVDKRELKFSYQVVRVNARASTYSVSYTSNNISSPIFNGTDDNRDRMLFSYCEVDYNGNYSSQVTNTNELSVHVQSSLRLKKNITTSTDQVYGDPNSTNSARHIGNSDLRDGYFNLSIGSSENVSIKLSDLVEDTTNVEFAHNGQSSSEAFENFNATFASFAFDMKLTKDQIVFTPKTSGISFFTVEIIRWDYSNGAPERFVTSDNPAKLAEIIRLTIFINGSPSTPTFGIKSSAEQNYAPFSDTKVIFLADRVSAAQIKFVDIVSVEVSDVDGKSISLSNQIVKHSFDNVNKKMTFTAVKSGVVTVKATYKRFNDLLEDSFTLRVESISQLTQAYSILTTERIYLNSIRADLKSLNAGSDFSGFDTLEIDTSDTQNAPNGFYFQTLNDNGEWTTVSNDQVGFIREVKIAQDASGEHLRIEVNNVASDYVPVRTRIVLKFVSLDRRFSAGIEISPANKLLQTAENTPLEIAIVYNEDMPGQDQNYQTPWREQASGIYVVPLNYLISLLPQSQREAFDGAKIGVITPEVGYETYFLISSEAMQNVGHVIKINPLYPTKVLNNGKVLVQVSVTTETRVNYLFSFYVSVSGITIDLDRQEYSQVFLFTMLSIFLLLFIVFMFRMAFFWKQRSAQRRIIRKNQMLIKMRDKMHNKTAGVSKEQIVRTKMKMEDPKYAKMFNEMRVDKEAETGISLDNSTIAQKASKTKVAEGKKKKGGKKSLEELKAELEAKKMTFAQMNGGVPPAMNIDSSSGIEMDQSIIQSAPVFENNEYRSDLSREDVENQIKAKLANEDNFLEFETIDPEDNGLV